VSPGWPRPRSATGLAARPAALWTRDRLGGDWGGARDGVGRHDLRFDLWATGFYQDLPAGARGLLTELDASNNYTYPRGNNDD